MDEAKEVHKCLRKAAGIFKFVKVNPMRLFSFISSETYYGTFISLSVPLVRFVG